MAGEKDDSLQSISVKLDGKNYSYWSYVMKNFLKGKKIWGYVTSTMVKPKNEKVEDYVNLLDVWEANNSKIITWINNSVQHSIGTQLAKYDACNEVWDHLARLYTQSNFAKQYQLESDIRALEQKKLQAFTPYITRRDEQGLVQFLMALRDDFERLRGSILHHCPLPSVDSVVSELLAEEIRFKSQAGKGTLSTPNPSVLAVPSKPLSNYQNNSYSSVAIDECSFCKQKGHWKAQYPKILNKASQQQQQQQPLPWKFGNQSQQHQPPTWKFGNHSQQQTYRPSQPNTAATVPSGSFGFDGPSSSNPNMSALAEKFQKFLATQPQAMSTSSPIGLLSPSSSDMFSSTWVLDSEASHHMSPNLSSFVSLCPASSLSVMTTNGTHMPLAGVGSVVTLCVSLSNVYHIPNLTFNLVSVSRRQGGLYFLDELKVPVAAAFGVDLSSFRLSSSSSSFYLWHSHLGHVSASHLKYLASTGALENLQTHDIFYCSGCKLAKFSTLPFNQSISSSLSPFDLVHSDVWGPSSVTTKGGSGYYVSFIDDYTRYCWVYLMKRRSDFLSIYLAFRALVKTQHSAVIKCFRCDLGGEYTSNKFCELLALDGTTHQTSYTNTPEQNGVAERKHRHIVETARSLLLSTYVPSAFWGEAVLTAVNLINKIPSTHCLGLSPFEKLYGHAPNYSFLKVFGCTCFVLRPHVERSKLSPRSAICVFLGYGEGQKGYCCFDPVTQKLYVSRHVVFLEHIPFFSILTSTHDMTKSDLIRIDPFSDDTDSLSSSVPCTRDTNSPSIPITHFPLHYSRRSRTDTSANTGTSLSDASDASDAPPLLAATQALTETMDPPRYPQRDREAASFCVTETLIE
ncbi:hypothetical protein EZV62_012207 [Acer yangbiense]|uniref:Integrase catalytic domain-containing protein n=1 Tax=Acer yangbiense TaxID=1000413 RepID=A0A5C7HVL1_9ROSI|nr:hypothetical protein EZV62_012207 [Acer yangbiense]